jgi:hypothetical protein
MSIPRRALLVAAAGSALLGATGCAAQSLPIVAAESPDDRTRRQTAVAEAALVERYRAAAAGDRRLAGQLEYFARQHEQHLAALYPDGVPDDIVAPGGGDAVASPAQLRRLESAAARQRTAAAVAAEDAGLVELLARLAASESGHAAYWSGGRW